MDRDGVMQWVARYEAGWRARDLGAVDTLFTADANYRRSPYEPSDVGQAAIRAFWREDDDVQFTMWAEPVAVDGDSAVVRVQVNYTAPRQLEYLDLWLLRFAPDGRVADFEEWPYLPGRSYSAVREAQESRPAAPT